MPLPSSINDLSIIAGSNSPAGSESPSTIDDYLRLYASYIAQCRDAAQSNGFNMATAGGTANAITATYSPSVTTLSDTTVLTFKATAANTGAATFSPNGLTANPIVGAGHGALAGGEIIANGEVCVRYNSSVGTGSWVILYSTGAAGTVVNQTLTAFTTAGTSPAFTLTPVPAVGAYASPQRFHVTFHAAASSAGTINVSGLGAKSLKQYDPSGTKVSAIIAAGQISDIVYDGTDMVVLDPLQAPGGLNQCQLKYVSATSIKLAPYNGNALTISGISRSIPAAGISLSNGGLSASTLYYIYAYWTGSAIALEASATGHSQDATTGVEIKTGDATRTLVGMIYTNASSQFADAPAARHVASWFNRRSVGGVLYRTTQTGFTNIGVMFEVSVSDRVSFLTWADESTEIKAFGQYIAGSSSNSVLAQSYVDGSPYGGSSSSYEPVANGGMVFASGSNFSIGGSPLSEGQHLAQLFAQVASGVSGGAITILTNSIMTRI